MKFVVLNGSPKGEDSVTLQYVRYMEKQSPNHQFEFHSIGKKIKLIEKDEKLFEEIINSIRTADGVIWAFPLYVLTVASQYKRFIELIFERNVMDAFKNKYTCLMATSIHFYDHTAINYMNGICDDLEMKYVDFYSAEMHDFLDAEKRKNLMLFAQKFYGAIEDQQATPVNFGKLKTKNMDAFFYKASKSERRISLEGKKLVVIVDSLKEKNVEQMIVRFVGGFEGSVEVVVLEDIDIKGGCLGCIQCGYNYECIYQGKDGFIDFYNEKVKKADIIIFAGKIQDRFLSSGWKAFMDRSFFNTHTPSLEGKQAGLLISGPLREIPNIRQIFEAYFQWQNCSMVGIVTDEYEDSIEIDHQISALAINITYGCKQDYKTPITYLGVGAWKIFRDEIWGKLRFPFIADYKAYKNMKKFDFPQKKMKSRILNALMIGLTKIPAVRKEIYHHKIKTEMVKDFKKIVEGVNPSV